MVAREKSATDLNQNEQPAPILPKDIGTDPNFTHEILWFRVVFFVLLHSFAVWGLIHVVTLQVKWQTVLWTLIIGYITSEGITIGAHRFYTHRSFKATFPLRFALVFMQVLSGQNSMYTWVRDHRLHHRFSDTDADPHNATRGFFFSHMGWLMCKKHPIIRTVGKVIDVSDLQADPLIMFQKKYFPLLYVAIGLLMPTCVPIYFWREDWLVALTTAYTLRYVISLNITWLVNSYAHFYGNKPYDKNIQPVEAWFVSLLSSGEGWHNYHHTYPWDYKAAELGTPLNFSSRIIDWLAKAGLAYDLKKAPEDMIINRILRTGDGSHPTVKLNH